MPAASTTMPCASRLPEAEVSPTKKRGSEVADLTVEILKDIREELREIKRATGETNQRLGRLEQRFDNLLEFAGDRYREHEERIRVLEKHAGLRSA